MKNRFSKSSIVTTVLDRGIGQYITGSVVNRKCIACDETYLADMVIDDELGNVYKCRNCHLLSETKWFDHGSKRNLDAEDDDYQDPVLTMPKFVDSITKPDLIRFAKPELTPIQDATLTMPRIVNSIIKEV